LSGTDHKIKRGHNFHVRRVDVIQDTPNDPMGINPTIGKVLAYPLAGPGIFRLSNQADFFLQILRTGTYCA
jgi:hypothetical protein